MPDTTYDEMLLWLDFETDGLSIGCQIIEVAWRVVARDSLSLIRLGRERTSYVANDDTPTVAQVRMLADPVVREMHEQNGLWHDWTEARSLGSALTEQQLEIELLAEMRLAEYLYADPDVPVVWHLAGSGVAHFDHPLIKRRMPTLASRLHYSTLDVGQLRRWLQPDTAHSAPPRSTTTNHRALADIRDQMLQLEAMEPMLA